MIEERNLNYDKLKQHYTKYIYFLISLCAAGIGFSFQQNKSFDSQLSFYLCLSSIILWGISILGGILIIETTLKSLSNDVIKIDLLIQQSNLNPTDRLLPQKIEEYFEPEYKKLQKRIYYFTLLQNWCLYLGIVIYIIFYVINTPIILK